MTNMSNMGSVAGATTDQMGGTGGTRRAVDPTSATGWVGWIAFAGVMMFMVGVFHIIEGLVAVFRDQVFLVSKSGLAVSVDYTTWGWVHMLGGVIMLFGAIALFGGKMWGRVLAVILAMVSMVLNIGFLSAYPIWSMMMIAIDILVIWAVMVHGREMVE